MQPELDAGFLTGRSWFVSTESDFPNLYRGFVSTDSERKRRTTEQGCLIKEPLIRIPDSGFFTKEFRRRTPY
eukprot:9379037-Pyramimonas_sp.AAC.1